MFAQMNRVKSSNGRKITVREYRKGIDFYIILHVDFINKNSISYATWHIIKGIYIYFI